MRKIKSLVRFVLVGIVLLFAFQMAQDAGVRMPTSLEDLEHPERLLGDTAEHVSDSAVPSSDPNNFSFLTTDESGVPARYNPCAPIRYVVNTSGATPGALEDTQAAFQRIEDITGLDFEFAGETGQVPSNSWYSTGDGSSYPPIIVAWVSPGETDMLTTAGASGNGGSDWLPTDSGREFVTGAVALNSDQNDLYTPGFGPGATRGNLLLHEIGHVVGLGHAETPGAIMYGQVGPSTPDGYAPGDLNGLASLGASQGCLPVLRP